jgi:hypothetical protein
VSDIEFEDIPGLPGKLPPGEYVVWQGRSSWRALARHTFKVRAVAAWLGTFSLLRLVVDLQAGQGLVGTLIAVLDILKQAGVKGDLAAFTESAAK